MTRAFTFALAGLVALTALPVTASAQVYPERVSIGIDARALGIARAYQGRDRDQNREEQTERTTKVLKLGAEGMLALGNIAGDITVSRGGGSEVTLDIVKTARGRTVEDARELLKLVPVEITERGDRADVKTRYPSGEEQRRSNRRNINVSVAYTVTAPAGTRVTITSISGTIKVTGIEGDVSANTISGDVRIGGGGRIGAAKTISGNVEIFETEADGPITTSSVSGDVILRRVTARQLDAGSVSGNIKLEDVQCERVSAATTSGNVWFGGTLARNGRYEFNSFSGEVRVTLSGNTGFELDANSFSGEVHTDFSITTKGRRSRKALSGTYGDGAAVLDLTTFSGSIVISKR